MNQFNSWSDIITASIQNLWIRLITILPSIIGAIIVLLIGFFLASALEKVARRVIQATGIDRLMREHPISKGMENSQIPFTPSLIVGWLVKWFFILVTLIAVANSLGWAQINEFLYSIAFYIPNVLIAVIILMAGLIIGRLVRNLIEAALKRSDMPENQTRFLASFAQTAIVIFSVMASLIQLKVASSIIQILFGGIVFSLSLAFGLAFGLGGRDKAAKLLEERRWSQWKKDENILGR